MMPGPRMHEDFGLLFVLVFSSVFLISSEQSKIVLRKRPRSSSQFDAKGMHHRSNEFLREALTGVNKKILVCCI